MSDQDKSQEVAEAKTADVPSQEVSIKITDDLVAKIDEAAAKAVEEKAAKAKAFRFHGTESSKKELIAADKREKSNSFIKAMAQGDFARASEISNERAKTINVTTGANGEFLVPDLFESEIHATFDGYNEIISDADVRTVNGPGNVFNLNELDSRVDAYYNVTENYTGVTASTPTYSEPQIALADVMGVTTITENFMEDTEVDIMADLSRQYGEEFARTIQNQLINGNETVSSVPTKGLMVVGGTTTVSMATTGSGYTGVQISDLRNMYYTGINIDHFQDANKDGKYYMSPLVEKELIDDAESKSGAYVFSNATVGIAPRPIVLSNQFDTPTTTTSDPFVLYGNLSRHLKIRRKRGMTMKLNTAGTSLDGRNLNYQLGRELVVSERIGFKVVLAEGLVRLVTA